MWEKCPGLKWAGLGPASCSHQTQPESPAKPTPVSSALKCGDTFSSCYQSMLKFTFVISVRKAATSLLGSQFTHLLQEEIKALSTEDIKISIAYGHTFNWLKTGHMGWLALEHNG